MRTFIRNILKRFGYDIVKTGVPYIPVTSSDKKIKIGTYEIVMPGNNVQLVNYQIYHDMNAQLGRLTAAAKAKYNSMSVIDIGANTGDTIAVIKNFAEVPVTAIEGDPVTFAYLEKNAAQFKDVTLINAYLSDKESTQKAMVDKSGWNATIIPSEDKGAELSFTTVDALADKGRIASLPVKVLKTDVEGYDTIILRGSLNFIKTCNPVIFIEYNVQNMLAIKEDGLTTILSLRDLGYSRAVFFDHKGALILITTLNQTDVISSLHAYAASSKNLVGYYDIAFFHESDEDIATAFIKGEQQLL